MNLARTTLVLVVALLLVACGGDDGDQPVPDLTTSAQEALCDDFVSSICDSPGFESFCTACVTSTGCADAASTGAITTECSPDPDNGIDEITVDMVRACADTAELAVCVMGGGCMFDALETTCP
jgi:hypothetical protein